MDGTEEGPSLSDLNKLPPKTVGGDKDITAKEAEYVGVTTRITEAGGKISDKTLEGMRQDLEGRRHAASVNAAKERAVSDAQQIQNTRAIIAGVGRAELNVRAKGSALEPQPRTPTRSFRETVAARPQAPLHRATARR